MPVSTGQFVVAQTAKPQNAFLTATAKNTAAPFNWRRILQSQFQVSDYQVQTQRNKGAATNTFYPSESRTISHTLAKPMPVELNSDDIVRWLYAACGQISSSQPDAGGNPTVYQHIIKLIDLSVSHQLPPFGVAEKAGTGLDQEFVGCVAREFTMAGNAVDVITGAVNWEGSGKRVEGSGLILEPTASFNLPAPTSLVYWKNTMLSLAVADSVSLANAINYCSAKRVRSWSLAVQNTLNPGFLPCAGDYQTTGDADSGAVASEKLVIDQVIVPQVVVRVEPGSVELQYLKEQRKLDFKLALTGATISGAYKHKVEYQAGISVYSAVQVGEDENFLTYAITADPLADLATGNVYQFIVTNNKAGNTYV